MNSRTRIALIGGTFNSPWTIPEVLHAFGGANAQARQNVTGVAQVLEITSHGSLRWRYVPVSALSDLTDLQSFTPEAYEKTVQASVQAARKAKLEQERVQREAAEGLERARKHKRKAIIGGCR